MKKIYAILLGSLMLFLTSCTEVELFNDYMKVSINSYTFDGSGEDSIAVTVESEEEWTAALDDNWVSMRTEGNKIILKADRNNKNKGRNTTLTLTTVNDQKTVLLDQLPYCFNGVFIDDIGKGAISRNGRYFAYMKVIQDTREGKIYDFQEGTVTDFEIPLADGKRYFNEVKAISDDGRTMIFYLSGVSVAKVYRDGKPLEMKLPEGYSKPNYQALSADGNITVGYCVAPKPARPFDYVGTIWRNGEPEFIELTEQDTTLTGQQIKSIIPRGCSADGSVVYIHIRTDNTLAYYKDGKFVNIALMTGSVIKDKESNRVWINALTMSAQQTSISQNGKYIASSMENKQTGECYAAIANTEDNTVKVFKDNPSSCGMAVSDEGIMFGATPDRGIENGLVYDINSDEGVSVDEWFSENLGVTLSKNRAITSFSPDFKTFYGMELLFIPRRVYLHFVLKL